MLTLYHNPISVNSRRVWIMLLEKQLLFDLVEVKLDGDQLQPGFLAISPFHHIPVLVDDAFKVVESLAILDYLEAKYPQPEMLPQAAEDLAIVRMVNLITVNELLPATMPLTQQMMGFAGVQPQQIEQAKQKVTVALNFLEHHLDDRPYFGSESLTQADIVAGTAVPWLPEMGVSLADYPKLNLWCQRLSNRPAWQATQPSPESLEAFKSQMETLMAQSSP